MTIFFLFERMVKGVQVVSWYLCRPFFFYFFYVLFCSACVVFVVVDFTSNNIAYCARHLLTSLPRWLVKVSTNFLYTYFHIQSTNNKKYNNNDKQQAPTPAAEWIRWKRTMVTQTTMVKNVLCIEMNWKYNHLFINRKCIKCKQTKSMQ